MGNLDFVSDHEGSCIVGKGDLISLSPARSLMCVRFLDFTIFIVTIQVKLECENAAQYWLGLISKAHHWGDSLVITGILSRIWYVLFHFLIIVL